MPYPKNKRFTDEQIKENLEHYHAVLQGETADLSDIRKMDLFRENPFPHYAAGNALNIKDGATTDEILELCKYTEYLWRDEKKQIRNTLRFIEKYEAAEKAEKDDATAVAMLVEAANDTDKSEESRSVNTLTAPIGENRADIDVLVEQTTTTNKNLDNHEALVRENHKMKAEIKELRQELQRRDEKISSILQMFKNLVNAYEA